MSLPRETFEKEILRCLRETVRRYSAMEQQDAVKFVFQAMLGVGHLLSSRDAVTEYIARETAPLPADTGEPLTERLSPSWCRLNLRRAKAEGFTPQVIAGLMDSAGTDTTLTRRDVFDFCRKTAVNEGDLITDPEALNRILDETWLPSHSAAYRERYAPAYRVISAEWIPHLETVRRISAIQAERVLVTLDGPCASGKTTLAGKLAGVFGAAVVHTDDYVIPHAQKTAERLAVPGGNCDAERLVREVVSPWKRGETVLQRKYDCREDRLMPEEQLPDCRILILEGSYCNLPEIRQYADLRIFLNVSARKQEERLRQRETPGSLQMFRDRWIPLEEQYFRAYGLPDPECVIPDGETE